VDLDPKNARFARKWTRIFGETVSVHVQDSLAYFASRSEPADLLYLDSWDTTLPGHAEHGLREIQAASHLLHSRTVVVYDDTSLLAGKWRGKGSLGVPWMLSHGWKVVHSGHQTVLVRA
jgi:spermidine synthase